MTKTEEVLVSDVAVGERFRKSMGNINGLAASMDEVGLLQPIGITPSRELIFGQRRLEAAKQLGWEHIAARVIDIGAIILGEHHENEFRLDFTPSERYAIAEALRAFSHGGDRKNTEKQGENQSDLSHFDPVTTEKAAEQAGMSRKEFFRVQKVVTNGTPELIESMDAGKIPVTVAAEVAELPKPEQKKVVQKVKAGKKPKAAAGESKPRSTGKPDGFAKIDEWLGKSVREADTLQAGQINRYAEDFKKNLDIARKSLKAWERACK